MLEGAPMSILIYSMQNGPEAPDAFNSDKRGDGGRGSHFFGKYFFHFFIEEVIGKILTTSRWPFPGLTDDLGIAVISFFCCYKWGSGAL